MKGETKQIIERSTSTLLKISSEGDVEIVGEGYEAFICEKIIRAIGRGFNPYTALRLLHEDCSLIVIDLKDFSGKSKNKLLRIKSRLIGKRGKARRVIERLTDCSLCVYGKTVALIGEFNELDIAFRGVEKLILGSPHGNVYGYLEREMRKLKSSI